MTVLRRTVGANISECLKQNKISLAALAKKMGYSDKDIQNLVEGKVIISPSELEKIAECLGTTKEYLTHASPEYVLPDLQFMKKFSKPDNLDLIIDLMDEYVECKEAVDRKES